MAITLDLNGGTLFRPARRRYALSELVTGITYKKEKSTSGGTLRRCTSEVMEEVRARPSPLLGY